MNLSSYTFYVIGLAFLLTLCNQNVTSFDCTKYKTGIYTFSYRQNEKIVHVDIERKGDSQKESEVETGVVQLFKINWTDACTYELRSISINIDLPKEVKESQKGMVLSTQILEGTDSYYIGKTRSNQNSEVRIDTIWLKK